MVIISLFLSVLLVLNSFNLYLTNRMGNMWKEMAACHQTQLKAVEAMKRLDNSAAFEPTTSSHRHDTVQLELALIKYVESCSIISVGV